jgi:hypothetical protein
MENRSAVDFVSGRLVSLRAYCLLYMPRLHKTIFFLSGPIYINLRPLKNMWSF